MYDQNDEGTLKIVPELKVQDVKNVNLPNDSNSFSWNNVRCLHGSQKIDGKEKLLACITGSYNLTKLDQLLQNSVDKYDHLSAKTLDDPYSKLLYR
jgi:dTDP-4-dehydrorhamnose 3,5-epimerase-like enzyme